MNTNVHTYICKKKMGGVWVNIEEKWQKGKIH